VANGAGLVRGIRLYGALGEETDRLVEEAVQVKVPAEQLANTKNQSRPVGLRPLAQHSWTVGREE